MRRIARLIMALAVAGTLAWLAAKGARGAISFLSGAAVSTLSFWWLRQIVSGLDEAVRGGNSSGAKAALHGLRIFVLCGVLYGILKVYQAFVPALVTGLLVAVAAITIEAIYELIYARNA